ncbi:hypothetical protein [Massilimicrobiota sp. An80]|uniref:hypothetical protein n=1 Tax=Massilimicrobiota sp. An80 TaxID=1965658 RepID=UPI000B438818|nr:hypothetical protein [Massilimicrobiota sp. An80]OUN32236.1 hypothetical protein B5G32_12085 [Massilimicrobiota sp. An80]HJA52701.1 hypothetical protein [Candidatus Massilimicrobiota merdigallinarum]
MNKLKILVAGASTMGMMTNTISAHALANTNGEYKEINMPSITRMSVADELKLKIEELKKKSLIKKLNWIL